MQLVVQVQRASHQRAKAKTNFPAKNRAVLCGGKNRREKRGKRAIKTLPPLFAEEIQSPAASAARTRAASSRVGRALPNWSGTMLAYRDGNLWVVDMVKSCVNKKAGSWLAAQECKSQVSKLTQLLIMTTTHKFSLQPTGWRRRVLTHSRAESGCR